LERAIRFFENAGYSCVWKHVGDDPKDEKQFVQQQNRSFKIENGDIKPEYVLQKQPGYWSSGDSKRVKEAEDVIASALERAMKLTGDGGD
jgi:hypothetical protein